MHLPTRSEFMRTVTPTAVAGEVVRSEREREAVRVELAAKKNMRLCIDIIDRWSIK